MVSFEVKSDFVKDSFPEVYDLFISELRNSNSRSNDISVDKIRWFISWGFFVKKAKTIEEMNQRDINYHEKLKLPYDQRVELELSRIRVDILMKAGSFVRGDRFNNTSEFIESMAREVVKSMMVDEQEVLCYPNVIESISEFIEFFKENEESVEDFLDLDLILDKINNSGMKSLTKRELNFLEKKSKESK
jgi:hypothetical protein